MLHDRGQGAGWMEFRVGCNQSGTYSPLFLVFARYSQAVAVLTVHGVGVLVVALCLHERCIDLPSLLGMEMPRQECDHEYEG